jgi:carboxyl-terminal processing protease
MGLAAGVVLHRWIVSSERDPVTTAAVFQDVMSAIRTSFVDSLSDHELAVRAAKGVVSSLGDPYSAVLSQEEFQSYRGVLGGTGSALGMTLVEGITGIRIGSVLSGSPADQAGLFAGQFVVAIDDVETAGAGFDRLVGQVSHAAGTTNVEVRTPGDTSSVAVELEPGPVRIPAVGVTDQLSAQVAYIALGAVSEHANRQLRAALASLDPRATTGVILDLRGILGGRLDEALEIADLFLAEGLRIGSVTRRQAFPAL